MLRQRSIRCLRIAWGQHRAGPILSKESMGSNSRTDAPRPDVNLMPGVEKSAMTPKMRTVQRHVDTLRPKTSLTPRNLRRAAVSKAAQLLARRLVELAEEKRHLFPLL